MDLKGRVVVLTGASRGIGTAIARSLAQRGVKLALAARSPGHLDMVKQAMEREGAQVMVVPTDVAIPEQRQALIERVEQEWGTIDVLINNAGLFAGGELESQDPAQVQQLLRVNLEAPIALTALALKGMKARDQGHIVNVASLGGLLPIGWAEVYAATKHGLVGFTRSLEVRLRAEGSHVHVSSVCPGFVGDLGMYKDRADPERDRPAFLLQTCTSEDVATAVLKTLADQQLERIVNVMPVRPLAALYPFTPGLGSRLVRWLGLHRLVGALVMREAPPRG